MRMKKGWMALSLAGLMAVSACGGGGGETEEEGSGGEASGEEMSGSITVSGSSAMQPLVSSAAEEFMAEYPEASVQVQAGGSGTGLSQVSEGSVDIGNSDIFVEEEEDIDAENMVDHRVAVVGMTAAVHPEAGVDDLTLEELTDVFTGEVTNWSEVGGEDQDITLVNRPDSSGTRATFVDYALDGETPAEGITEDSSNTVKQIVGDTEGAIGYLAFSYFDDESVTAVNIDGVEPTDENVQSGEFPIWAYQHSYTNGEPEGLTQEFLDYMMSDSVQTELVPELGYIAATEMEVERDAEGNETEVE